MQNPTQYIAIIILVALVIIKRLLRAFAYQRFSKGILSFRITLYSIIALILMWYAAIDATLYLFDLCGLVLGVGLIFAAVKNMVFEKKNKELYFKTHAWVEIVILSVFFIRLAYKYYVVSTEFANDAPEFISRKLRYSSDPITSVVFFLLCTYYIGYYGYVYYTGKEKLAAIENEPVR